MAGNGGADDDKSNEEQYTRVEAGSAAALTRIWNTYIMISDKTVPA